MTNEQREQLTVVTQFFCFLPMADDLFMAIDAAHEKPRLFWAAADGFEEVTAEEAARRVAASRGSEEQP